MAATKRNAMLIDEAREKIKTTQLINRLQNHALGTVEMSPTQVRATEILLKKRVPDLSSVEHSGEVATRSSELSDDALARIIGAGRGKRAAETQDDPKIIN